MYQATSPTCHINRKKGYSGGYNILNALLCTYLTLQQIFMREISVLHPFQFAFRKPVTLSIHFCHVTIHICRVTMNPLTMLTIRANFQHSMGHAPDRRWRLCTQKLEVRKTPNLLNLPPFFMKKNNFTGQREQIHTCSCEMWWVNSDVEVRGLFICLRVVFGRRTRKSSTSNERSY